MQINRIMQTIKSIMDANSDQSLAKWAHGINGHTDEKINRFNIFHWVKNNSIPPSHWVPFVMYSRELGSDISVEEIFNVWIRSRKERKKKKTQTLNL